MSKNKSGRPGSHQTDPSAQGTTTKAIPDHMIPNQCAKAIHKAPRPTTQRKLDAANILVTECTFTIGGGVYAPGDSEEREACREIDRLVSLLGSLLPAVIVALGEDDLTVEFTMKAVEKGQAFIQTTEPDPMSAYHALRAAESALRERLTNDSRKTRESMPETIPGNVRVVPWGGSIPTEALPLWMSVEGFMETVKFLGLAYNLRIAGHNTGILVGNAGGKWRVIGVTNLETSEMAVNRVWARAMELFPENERQPSNLAPTFADAHGPGQYPVGRPFFGGASC